MIMQGFRISLNQNYLTKDIEKRPALKLQNIQARLEQIPLTSVRSKLRWNLVERKQSKLHPVKLIANHKALFSS